MCNANFDKVKINEEVLSSQILGKRFSEFPSPSRIPVFWKVMGSTPVGELGKSFYEY